MAQHESRPQVHAALARWLEKADGKAIEYVRTTTNVDVSGHSPEHLRLIDDLLDEGLREVTLERDEIESTSLMFGAYLGEVFVRNLAARWHYPRFVHALVIALSRNRTRGERFFYVILGSEKVRVFWAAREAIMKTGAVFSLRAFYQAYAGRVARSPQS